MTCSRRAAAALLAVAIGAVAAVGTSGPGATAAGPDRGDAAPVIVPGAPGERAVVYSPTSARVLAVTRRSARSERHNAADRRFMRHMIPHHYQAILMSRMARKRFGDKRVKSIAARIRTEQNVEIDGMQGWQSREGLAVTNAKHGYHHMLEDPEMLEHMGMATPREMKKLRASRDRAFDRRYLNLMITHHRGAIRMAEGVAGDGNDLFVRQFATDMISSQSNQIHDMRKIRRSWK